MSSLRLDEASPIKGAAVTGDVFAATFLSHQ
jgi:hypothetical protein